MPASDQASYLLGMICGLSLLGLLATAVALALRPMVRERDRRFGLALAIAVAVTLVKLALLRRLQGVTVDLMQFELWGRAMAQFGPAHIYDPRFLCKYTPAYLYALWPAAALAPNLPEYPRMFIESLPIIADLLLAVTVYAAARRVSTLRFALPATLLVVLNPALIYSSTVWGQNDSVLAFPLLLSVLMAAESCYALAWALAVVAALIKAQGLILLPILAWWTLATGKHTDWLRAAGAAVATAVVVLAPFQLGHPWHFVLDVYAASMGWFPWASVNAFNLMLALGGLIVLDSHKLYGPVSFSMLGYALFGAVYILAGWIAWRRRTSWGLMFSVFIVYFGMFMFMPRMHERYLFYAVALLGPLSFSSWTTIALYTTLSVTLLLDMAYVFCDLFYVKGFVEGHLLIGPDGQLAIAIVNLAAFALAAVYGVAVASRGAGKGEFCIQPRSAAL
jgi:dolichyl-phosphate-mannose-protein mannosyltransferase